VHYLVYKISKEVVNKVENSIKNNVAVDVNVREDFRWTIKKNDPKDDPKADQLMKTVVLRVVPTRYTELQPLYAIFYQFQWRRTGMGGIDELNITVQECPKITNSTTINGVCYKEVSRQLSYGGTHGTRTYMLISPRKGNYEIGEWVHYSNVNAGGHHHGYTRPVTINI